MFRPFVSSVLNERSTLCWCTIVFVEKCRHIEVVICVPYNDVSNVDKNPLKQPFLEARLRLSRPLQVNVIGKVVSARPSKTPRPKNQQPI